MRASPIKPTAMGQRLEHFPCEKWLSKLGLLEPKELGASREELIAHPIHQGNSSAESSLHREVEQSPSLEVLKMYKENLRQINLHSTWSLLAGEGYACGAPKVPSNLNESDLCMLSPLL